MEDRRRSGLSRRFFLRMGLALPVPLLLARILGYGAPRVAAQGTNTATPMPTGTPVLIPTPACGDDDDDDITPALTEGPYFKARSPERTSLLEPGVKGVKIIVAGYVLSTTCQPVARALLDFWQADGEGAYDNVGYRLRGHQFTDEMGRYTLETVYPGIYPGRTRHIHLKVQAPNGPVLTTQLFFPGEPGNLRDRIFNTALVTSLLDPSTGELLTPAPQATPFVPQVSTDGQVSVFAFNFVLRV